MTQNQKNKPLLKYTLFTFLIAGAIVGTFLIPHPTIEQNDEGDWHLVWRGNLASAAENDPGADVSGWLATFCLDYAETPGTCLASNASGGGYDGWTNVSGYVSADGDGNPAIDLASEDPFYFVVRCRFNDSIKSGGEFMGDRCRVTLNVTGDETIDDVIIYGNGSAETYGGGIVSQNVSTNGYIWINFYWDYNSDGYEITDDGSLEWNITIEMKY